MASQQGLIRERTDANVKLGERGMASKEALPGISFLYTRIFSLPLFYAQTPIVEVLTSLHNTLMVVVAPRSIVTFESVLKCPVLERLFRVLRHYPPPRELTTPAPHSGPRDRRRKKGRQRLK